MERSLDRAPYLTAIMMEFLFFAIENYCPPLREYIQEHVAKAAQSITEKGVIRYERDHLTQCILSVEIKAIGLFSNFSPSYSAQSIGLSNLSTRPLS